MIKVIEHGYSKYRIRCPKCNCLFEYEIKDIDVYSDTVRCPDCKYECGHNFTLNVDMSSRIKEPSKNV